MSREENRRELPEGVVTQSGACRYCGQMHLIHASGCMDDERLVYEATMMCDCGEHGNTREKCRGRTGRRKRWIASLAQNSRALRIIRQRHSG